MQGAAHLLPVKREWGRGAFCRGSFSTSCLVWGGHFLKEDHYPESHFSKSFHGSSTNREQTGIETE